MSAKSTPGPWYAVPPPSNQAPGYGWCVIEGSEESLVIANLAVCDGLNDKANAELIAAAPALADALEALLREDSALIASDDLACGHSPAEVAGREALRLAGRLP